MAQSQIILANS